MPPPPTRPRIFTEINLVPLIDVSLILVVIFMVLSPLLVRSQLPIRLPRARSGKPAASGATLVVRIEKGGALSVEGTPVSWSGLDHELLLRLGHSSRKTVLIQAEKSVPVQSVVRVLDSAKRLGAGKLGLGIEPVSR